MSDERGTETPATGSTTPGGWVLAPAPSRGRKIAFWLLFGMLSVVCVEVPAGSTMFPFFTPWGLLVVWPLYLLHSVFLAGLVFRVGRPGFWPLYAAGMLFGMYEAYITKVVWVSFRPEGPMFQACGIALFETMLLVLFLHPLLAFVVPLFFAEILLTRSHEVFRGLPRWIRELIRGRPMVCASLLMTMFGLMQFVNSPSPLMSCLSGAGNGLVISLVVLWWRRSGGAAYSLRDLLPGPRGLKWFGALLLAWYLFWGIAIKPKSIPAFLHGQLTVWVIYAFLLWIFYGCLVQSRQPSPPDGETGVAFTWTGLLQCVVCATVVTTAARLWLSGFARVQMAIFLLFSMSVGLALLIGAIRCASKRPVPEAYPGGA